jgi:hypothetical protein
MTREEFYEELRLGIIERFWKILSEEERDIIRKNADNEYAKVVKKILGNEIVDKLPKTMSPEDYDEVTKQRSLGRKKHGW